MDSKFRFRGGERDVNRAIEPHRLAAFRCVPESASSSAIPDHRVRAPASMTHWGHGPCAFTPATCRVMSWANSAKLSERPP
jgi:hypothetical protein